MTFYKCNECENIVTSSQAKTFRRVGTKVDSAKCLKCYKVWYKEWQELEQILNAMRDA